MNWPAFHDEGDWTETAKKPKKNIDDRVGPAPHADWSDPTRASYFDGGGYFAEDHSSRPTSER